MLAGKLVSKWKKIALQYEPEPYSGDGQAVSEEVTEEPVVEQCLGEEVTEEPEELRSALVNYGSIVIIIIIMLSILIFTQILCVSKHAIHTELVV